MSGMKRPMRHTSYTAITPRPETGDAPSDEVLLASLGRGDLGAGRAFVRRFQRRVYGLAKTMVGDPTEAEDIAQEALSRALRHPSSYDSRRGSVATWILTMTRNLALDTLRRKSTVPVDPRAMMFFDQPAHGPVPEELATIADQTNQVRTALSELPAEQRRVLVLAALYGWTVQEISQAEAVPVSTAKSRLRLGLIKLRALLDHDRTIGEIGSHARSDPDECTSSPTQQSMRGPSSSITTHLDHEESSCGR
ncbi:MAG: sigma-70 family RNA polymerase sigma factor [Acidimicrobiales bacterium]